MTDFPLVSVVIPTYNRADYLPQAIQSVLDQTYPHHEIIVVDDGSTDNTADVMLAFGEMVHYVHQENAGVSAARNRGMEAARGDYIAFLDSDDAWLPERLEQQIAYFQQHPAVSMVYSAYQTMNAAGEVLAVVPMQLEGDVYRQWLLACHVATSTVMVSRQMIDQVGGFDTRLTVAEDTDLWLRIAQRALVGLVRAPLVNYRWHPSNTARDPRITLRALLCVAGKHFGSGHQLGWRLRRQVWARAYYTAGHDSLSAPGRSIMQALRYGLTGLIWWPLDRKGAMLFFRLLLRMVMPPRLQARLRPVWRKVLYRGQSG